MTDTESTQISRPLYMDLYALARRAEREHRAVEHRQGMAPTEAEVKAVRKKLGDAEWKLHELRQEFQTTASILGLPDPLASNPDDEHPTPFEAARAELAAGTGSGQYGHLVKALRAQRDEAIERGLTLQRELSDALGAVQKAVEQREQLMTRIEALKTERDDAVQLASVADGHMVDAEYERNRADRLERELSDALGAIDMQDAAYESALPRARTEIADPFRAQESNLVEARNLALAKEEAALERLRQREVELAQAKEREAQTNRNYQNCRAELASASAARDAAYTRLGELDWQLRVVGYEPSEGNTRPQPLNGKVEDPKAGAPGFGVDDLMGLVDTWGPVVGRIVKDFGKK